METDLVKQKAIHSVKQRQMDFERAMQMAIQKDLLRGWHLGMHLAKQKVKLMD